MPFPEIKLQGGENKMYGKTQGALAAINPRHSNMNWRAATWLMNMS